MLATPVVISKSNCIGAPIAFDWDDEISSRYAFDKELNVRMADAADESNYRTNITLAVCAFEWFIRRFEGLVDLSDAYLRLEAAYACAINPFYINISEFDKVEVRSGTPLSPDQVLDIGIYRIWESLKICISTQIGVSGESVNLFLLVHHVMPDSSPFDQWLEAALRRGAETFPREVNSYDWENNFYNYGVERIVPREFFFEPEFEYTDESATTVLQEFLDSLDPGANPYLQTAEAMNANGYSREPYKLVDLRKG